MTKRRIGLYPGTFDPITNGHLDIIIRAATHLVDELIVGVARNIGKGPMFNVDERVQMVQDQAAVYKAKLGVSVVVKSFDNLLVEFSKDNGVDVIVRGLRAVSDFEYEFQMASMNRCLDDEIETAFLMASDRNHFISSRFVKEIAQLGGDISQFVPAGVAEMVRHKFIS
ncbi:MAG: pantetheine-phosphate adenylyltransferase [Alphaproteobacteria bacterium]|nr:pantetheine-phosphate adenylyltransferase [Alphaproteobacteria bacterium]